MPYKIEKRGKKYAVINMDTGMMKGMHSSRMKAQKQMNLMRAIEHGWKPTGKK